MEPSVAKRLAVGGWDEEGKGGDTAQKIQRKSLAYVEGKVSNVSVR